MWLRHSQTTGPGSKTNAESSAISITGPVGIIFTVSMLLISLLRVHPVRWLLAASLAFGLISGVILRFAGRR